MKEMTRNISIEFDRAKLDSIEPFLEKYFPALSLSDFVNLSILSTYRQLKEEKPSAKKATQKKKVNGTPYSQRRYFRRHDYSDSRGRRWTKAEDMFLIKNKNKMNRELAKELRRSLSAVMGRKYKLRREGKI